MNVNVSSIGGRIIAGSSGKLNAPQGNAEPRLGVKTPIPSAIDACANPIPVRLPVRLNLQMRR